MEKLDGNRHLYRGWFFDVMVAIGQVDEGLAIEIQGLVARGLDEKWDPERDKQIEFCIIRKIEGIVVRFFVFLDNRGCKQHGKRNCRGWLSKRWF